MKTIEYITEQGLRGSALPEQYPDNTPLMQEVPSGPINKLLLRPFMFSDFMAAMFWVDSMRWRGIPVRHLILPFFPGARQDRLNDSGDQLFTAKSVANIVNERYFESVTVLDPHSDVVPALLDRCKVIHAADCIDPPPGKYDAVISPDGGAEKRAWRVAKKLGVPLYHAWKSRDVATGKISGFGCEPMPGVKLALLVDDICDGGGTFMGLAEKLQCKAHLWTTHGLYTAGTKSLLEKFGHLYCTDSVILKPRGESVIENPVCEKLLEGIWQ